MIKPYPDDKDAVSAQSVWVIYNFLCWHPRCGAVFPGTFVPVLMWEGKCSCGRAKPAHFVGHLPEESLKVWTVKQCHPERSEGSVVMGSEMLRCAQHDRAGPFCCWGTVKCIWTMPNVSRVALQAGWDRL